MKKKWITFGVFIISVGAFYCVEQQQSSELSSLALENIEALAQDEWGGEDRKCFGTGDIDCYGFKVEKMYLLK